MNLKTYRTNDNGKSHRNYYHWGKYLKTMVSYFGVNISLINTFTMELIVNYIYQNMERLESETEWLYLVHYRPHRIRCSTGLCRKKRINYQVIPL